MGKISKRTFGFLKKPKTTANLTPTTANLTELFNHVYSAIAVYKAVNDGEDFIFIDFNPAAETIEKIKKEELIGKSVCKVFPGVKEFGLFKVFQEVYKTGKPQNHPVSLYKDHRIIGWRENYVYKEPSGSIVAIYHDASEKQDSQLALKTTEQCFRAIADYTYCWEIWVSPNGKLLWTNPAATQMTGYTIKELMTMADFPSLLIQEQDRKRMEKAFKSALKGSAGKEVEFHLLKKNDTVIWVDISWQSIYDNKGTSQGFRASIHDITERKATQDALMKSQNRYRILLNSLPQKIFYKDINSVYLLCNDSFAKDLNITPEQIVGKTDYNFFPKELADKYRADDKRITKTGKNEEIEEKYIQDGKTVIVRTLKAPTHDRDGNITGILGIFWQINKL